MQCPVYIDVCSDLIPGVVCRFCYRPCGRRYCALFHRWISRRTDVIRLLHPWHQLIKIVIFSALHFHVLYLAVLLTEGLIGVVFRRLLAHRWEIYVFTTQGLAAMLFTAYRLVLGGALLLAAQQILMLLCQKTSSSSRLCSGLKYPLLRA